MISPRLAKALGIARLRRSVSLRLADGRGVRLGVGVAVVRIDGREAPITMLVGRVPEPILGVEALGGLGPGRRFPEKRLATSRPYAVRLGGYR